MQPANTTFIGIDWADKKHDFHLVDPDGKIQFGVFEQTPKAIADVVEAKLLAQYLIHYIDKLKPLEQDQPLTREIAAMSEDRRRMVGHRADLANEMTAVLKTYFPAILLLKAAKPYAAFVLTLLLKYPSLELIQKAGEHKLRKLFLALGLQKTTFEVRIETHCRGQCMFEYTFDHTPLSIA